MASVGVIIPTFNRATMLCDCLESLLLQTRPVDEILVVDDGSTDGTVDIVSERFGGRVRVIRKENGGKAAALNLGLEQVRTDLVWFCDDDDIAAPQACERLAAVLEGAADPIGFAHGHYRIFKQDGSDVMLRPPAFWSRPEEESTHINVLEDLYVFQFATMFRRSALQSVGLFREDLLRSQDFEMMVRITGAFHGVYVPETVFYQRDHDGSRGPTLDRVAQAESFRRWFYYDTLFFQDLAQLNTELVPSFARARSPQVRTRAAALQRAVVFGRRGMWDVALKALDLAVTEAQGEGASPEEVRLAGRLIRHGLPSEALPSRWEHLAQFRKLRTRSRYGAALFEAVSETLTERLRHAIRQRRFGDARRDALFLLAGCGVKGPLNKIAGRVGLRDRPKSTAATSIAAAGIHPSEISEFSALLARIEQKQEARQIESVRMPTTPTVDRLILSST